MQRLPRLLLLVGSLAITLLLANPSQALSPITEEEALTVIDLPALYVRVALDGDNPTFCGFPKDNSGGVIEEYWIQLQLTSIAEYRCRWYSEDSSIFGVLPNPGTLDGCMWGLGETVVNSSTAGWTHDVVSDREYVGSVEGFAGASSRFALSFYGAENEEFRILTNDEGATRTIRVNANSLKLSFDIQNYESQTDPFDGDYYSLWLDLLLEFSHPIAPMPSPFHPGQFLPSISLTNLANNQATFIFNIYNDTFKVRLNQVLFSLNHPPVVTTELYPEEPSRWGFEALNVITSGWNRSNGQPNQTSFTVRLGLSGSTDIFYDPDLSILVEGMDEPTDDIGEDGYTADGIADDASSSSTVSNKNSDDDDDDTVAIAVGVTVPLVVLVAVAVLLFGIFQLVQRKKREQTRLSRLDSAISNAQGLASSKALD
ncbi:hypothetical protein QOT17_017244 [Balamuthia mandrillaris]